MRDPAASEHEVAPHSLERLRLFPLPDTVFFPGTVLPLHVFEPRYRAMVADALEEDRVMAVALLKPGYEGDYGGCPPVYDVVGVGRITSVQQAKDGRYYLALHGLCRARILGEHPPVRPYRLARAELQPDVLPDGGEEALRPDVDTLRSCLDRLMRRMPDRHEALAELMAQVASAGSLSDVLCAAALESAEDRQGALACANVRERLRMATDAVAGLIIKGAEEDGPAGGVLQ